MHERGAELAIHLSGASQHTMDVCRAHLISVVDSMRERILQMDLTSQSEVDAHRSALFDHLGDSNTIVIERTSHAKLGDQARLTVAL